MAFSLRLLGAVSAVGALALACGARTSIGGAGGTTSNGDAGGDGAPFPVGTYTHCAFGTVSSGPLLIPSGFDDGATLTVAQSGDARTATYVDGSGRSYAWTFSPTTSASAVLAPSGQSTAGFGSSICVYGLGVSNEKFFPTVVDATAGAMTYESGAVFLSLEGELTSQTDCGDVSAPASTWIGCTGGPSPDVSAPASTSAFPVGDYTCTSQVGTHATLDGKNAFISSGGNGSLTLTQSGAQVTAAYTGDSELTGTLALTLDTAATGRAIASQSLTARCELGPPTGTLSISAASLAAEGGTVFLSFAGGISPSGDCTSAEKIAALVCTKK